MTDSPSGVGAREIETVAYQADTAAKNRPCGTHPCSEEFPGMPSRWCSGCLIAALLSSGVGARAPIEPLIEKLAKLPRYWATMSDSPAGGAEQFVRVADIEAALRSGPAQKDAPKKSPLGPVVIRAPLHIHLTKEEREEMDELARLREAERTVASIAAMLGWGNVPPRETLERDINALKARAQKDAPAWQPIETAPKDGTWVLVHHRNWTLPEVAQCCERGYWQSWNESFRPDHWMPIPPVPAGAQKDAPAPETEK